MDYSHLERYQGGNIPLAASYCINFCNKFLPLVMHAIHISRLPLHQANLMGQLYSL